MDAASSRSSLSTYLSVDSDRTSNHGPYSYVTPRNSNTGYPGMQTRPPSGLAQQTTSPYSRANHASSTFSISLYHSTPIRSVSEPILRQDTPVSLPSQPHFTANNSVDTSNVSHFIEQFSSSSLDLNQNSVDSDESQDSILSKNTHTGPTPHSNVQGRGMLKSAAAVTDYAPPKSPDHWSPSNPWNANDSSLHLYSQGGGSYIQSSPHQSWNFSTPRKSFNSSSPNFTGSPTNSLILSPAKSLRNQPISEIVHPANPNIPHVYRIRQMDNFNNYDNTNANNVNKEDYDRILGAGGVRIQNVGASHAALVPFYLSPNIDSMSTFPHKNSIIPSGLAPTSPLIDSETSSTSSPGFPMPPTPGTSGQRNSHNRVGQAYKTSSFTTPRSMSIPGLAIPIVRTTSGSISSSGPLSINTMTSSYKADENLFLGRNSTRHSTRHYALPNSNSFHRGKGISPSLTPATKINNSNSEKDLKLSPSEYAISEKISFQKESQCSPMMAWTLLTTSVIFPPLWLVLAAGYFDYSVGVVPRKIKLLAWIFGLFFMLITFACIVIGLVVGLRSE